MLTCFDTWKKKKHFTEIYLYVKVQKVTLPMMDSGSASTMLKQDKAVEDEWKKIIGGCNIYTSKNQTKSTVAHISMALYT